MNSQETPSRSEYSPQSPESEEGVDLSHMVGVVSEARWFIAGIAAVVLALTLVFSFLKTPVFQADTVLQVLSQQAGGLNGLEQLSALVQGSVVPTDTEIQLLQTRSVLVPVIRKLHLDISANAGFFSKIGQHLGLGCPKPAAVTVFEVPPDLQSEAFTVELTGPSTYKLLDPDDNEVLSGKFGAPAVGRVQSDLGPGLAQVRIMSVAPCAGSYFYLTQIPMDQEVTTIAQQLNIEEIGLDTGVVGVTLKGNQPTLIAQVLNEIARTNVEQNVLQNSSQAAKQLDFLNAQLPDLEKRFHNAQDKMAQFLSQNSTLAALSESTEYLITQASTLDQQIGPLEAQAAQAKAALGVDNPELKILGAQLQTLNDERTQLMNGIAKLPKDQQTLVSLQSDVTTSQNLYIAMLNQIQTMQITKAGTIGDIAIVDLALVPSLPNPPTKPEWALIGLVLGLLVGVVSAFVRRALRKGIEDPDVLDERLGLPVLAVLPHSPTQRRLERRREALHTDAYSLLAAIAPEEQATEALRSLRTSLQLAMPNTGRRILSLTSLSPGEGKSFICGNLSYVFAQGGARVLLVDADLRRGHLNRVFGWTRGKGLADVLQGEVTFEQAVRPTKLEGLHVLTTGTLPSDAASLLVNSDFGGLMDKLAGMYDLVVIDAPPVLAVGDAYVIARHANFNLLVVKHGLHSVSQVRLVLKRFARQGVNLSGSVLNDLSAAAQRYAYRGYGYQYQYKYK